MILLQDHRFDLNQIRKLMIPYLKIRSMSQSYPQSYIIPFDIFSSTERDNEFFHSESI